MSDNSVKTIHHTKLELLERLKIAFAVDQYSTLNEKFNILTSESVPADEYPSIGYIAIGRGGHRNAVGVGDQGLTDTIEHSPTDAALKEHMPFIMREVANDLSVAEREKYRVRVEQDINGTMYALYYLRKMDFVSSNTETRVIEVANGVITSDEEYVPSVTNLDPPMVLVSNTLPNGTDGRFIVVKANISMELDSSDIQEIINAVRILHNNDLRYATISEVGIVSGFEKDITGGFKELTHAQIMNFVSTHQPLQFSPTRVKLSYSLSNTFRLLPTIGSVTP